MPHIEQLVVQNYRVLKEVTLDGLQPLSVVLGPNGCGKSTLFDVFGFLSDALQTNVRKAIEPRGRLRELRSRGSTGPIGITVRYRESAFEIKKPGPVITYHVAVDSRKDRPYVCEEYLQWRRGSHGKPFKFLDMKDGAGEVITGEFPEPDDERKPVRLDSPDILAIKALGQLAENPRVASLRRFIEGWFLSIFVSSHSPYFVNALRPEELWIMDRDRTHGFATNERADRIGGVPEFVQVGASLGNLWTEDQFRRGNP